MSETQVAMEMNLYGDGVILYVKKPRTELTLQEFESLVAQVTVLKRKLGIQDERDRMLIDEYFQKF